MLCGQHGRAAQPCELQVGSTSQQCNRVSCKLAARASSATVRVASWQQAAAEGLKQHPALQAAQPDQLAQCFKACAAQRTPSTHSLPVQAGNQASKSFVAGSQLPQPNPPKAVLSGWGAPSTTSLSSEPVRSFMVRSSCSSRSSLPRLAGKGQDRYCATQWQKGRSSESIRECRLPRLAGKGWVRCCSRALTQKQGSELRS